MLNKYFSNVKLLINILKKCSPYETCKKYYFHNFFECIGTSASLINHLRYMHENLRDKYLTLKVEKNQPSAQTRQSKISDKEKQQIDKFITDMIGVDMLPYSFVENAGFRMLLAYFVPDYEPSHRTTISGNLMPDLSTNAKDKVATRMQQDFDDDDNCL